MDDDVDDDYVWSDGDIESLNSESNFSEESFDLDWTTILPPEHDNEKTTCGFNHDNGGDSDQLNTPSKSEMKKSLRNI